MTLDYIPEKPSVKHSTWGLITDRRICREPLELGYVYGKTRVDAEILSADVATPYGVSENAVTYDSSTGTVHIPGLQFTFPGGLVWSWGRSGIILPVMGTVVLLATGVCTQSLPLLFCGVAWAASFTGLYLVERQRRKEAIIGPAVTDSSGTTHRVLTAGTNSRLSYLMSAVHQASTGHKDPLWDMYEQIIDLAEEGSHATSNAQAQLYNQAVQEQAEELRGAITDRATRQRQMAQEADAAYREGLREVQAINDRVAIAGLQGRLAELTQSIKESRKALRPETQSMNTKWPGT